MNEEISITEDDLLAAHLQPAEVVIRPENLPPGPETLSVEIQEVICTYCHDVIASDEEIVVCSECQAPYHRLCWDDSGGCGVLDCKGKRNIPLA